MPRTGELLEWNSTCFISDDYKYYRMASQGSNNVSKIASLEHYV